MVNGAISARTTRTITFDGGTVADDALVGREIIINNKKYKVESNTSTTIKVRSKAFLPAIDDNTVIYPADEAGRLALTYNEGETVYFLGDITEENFGKERQLINFGANIIIFPDKVYFNTADTTDYGSMEKIFRNIDDEDHYNKWYVVKPCDIEGNEYVANYYGSGEPTGTINDGYVWYDTAEKVIKVWAEAYSMWTTPTIYHKYRIEGIGIF